MKWIAAVALVAAVLACVGCASSASGPKPPEWLEKSALGMKQSLHDPDAKLSYVLGPFPIAVVRGHLTCGGCPRPAEAPAQRGSAAAARYDGGTHESTDFSIVRGSTRAAIHGVCYVHHDPSCSRGGVAVRRLLKEGVSSRGVIPHPALHFSDAQSRRLAIAARASWRHQIEARARRWPQYRWPNPPVASTQAAIRRLARRYGFRVKRLVWQTPKQLAPELVIQTAHYRGGGRAIFWLATRVFNGYEGYYVEADDERGVPFDFVSRSRRGPSGGGRGWARSDAVAPFAHL